MIFFTIAALAVCTLVSCELLTGVAQAIPPEQFAQAIVDGLAPKFAELAATLQPKLEQIQGITPDQVKGIVDTLTTGVASMVKDGIVDALPEPPEEGLSVWQQVGSRRRSSPRGSRRDCQGACLHRNRLRCLPLLERPLPLWG